MGSRPLSEEARSGGGGVGHREGPVVGSVNNGGLLPSPTRQQGGGKGSWAAGHEVRSDKRNWSSKTVAEAARWRWELREQAAVVGQPVAAARVRVFRAVPHTPIKLVRPLIGAQFFFKDFKIWYLKIDKLVLNNFDNEIFGDKLLKTMSLNFS